MPLGEWQQLYWYSAVLILTAQMSDTVKEFFMGEGPGVIDHLRYFILGNAYAAPTQEQSRDKVGFWTLMPSGEHSEAPPQTQHLLKQHLLDVTSL